MAAERPAMQGTCRTSYAVNRISVLNYQVIVLYCLEIPIRSCYNYFIRSQCKRCLEAVR